jgi:hypothetical protein
MMLAVTGVLPPCLTPAVESIAQNHDGPVKRFGLIRISRDAQAWTVHDSGHSAIGGEREAHRSLPAGRDEKNDTPESYMRAYQLKSGYGLSQRLSSRLAGECSG